MDGNDGFGEDIHVLRRNWAESIRMILDDNRLTLEAFVERVALETDVEIAAKTVSRWLKPEEGGGLPEYAKMRAVAVAFGIPVASLLDDRAYDGHAAHVPRTTCTRSNGRSTNWTTRPTACWTPGARSMTSCPPDGSPCSSTG